MGGNGTRLVTPEGEGMKETKERREKDRNKGKKGGIKEATKEEGKEGNERRKQGWTKEMEKGGRGKREGRQTLYNPSRNRRSFLPYSS